jgi:hypothetical protein
VLFNVKPKKLTNLSSPEKRNPKYSGKIEDEMTNG